MVNLIAWLAQYEHTINLLIYRDVSYHVCGVVPFLCISCLFFPVCVFCLQDMVSDKSHPTCCSGVFPPSDQCTSAQLPHQLLKTLSLHTVCVRSSVYPLWYRVHDSCCLLCLRFTCICFPVFLPRPCLHCCLWSLCHYRSRQANFAFDTFCLWLLELCMCL